MNAEEAPPPPSDEDLRTNARLLSLIYDNMSDPVCLVRVEGGRQFRFVSANESFLRMIEHRADQVINEPMEYVVAGANLERTRSMCERVIASRQPVHYEDQAEVPAGVHHAEITLIPIFEGDGPVTHILADFRDITARRIAELEREQLLGKVVFISDATRLLASLDIERALGDVARLAVPYLGDGCAVDVFDEGGPRRVIAIASDPGAPMLVELHPTVLRGTALTYWIGSLSCLGVPLLIKGRLTGAITMRAPTNRRYTTEDLQLVEELGRRAAMTLENARLYRSAQDALRAREELLLIAAHEIRGPITSIHLAVQGLAQGKLPEEAQRRTLALIEREDRRLSRFVGELLELAQLRAGNLQLELEQVDLADLVQDIVKRFRLELTASGSPLTITAQPNVVGEWDKLRLDQVIANLLSNAIKFGRGKPIEISVSTAEGRARLGVQDHGIGIDPSARGRIFNPFERNVSARHYGGLGIGLHIVKTIVTAMGGSVRVEGDVGVGSTFIVELPLRSTPEPTDAHPDR